VSSTSTPSIEGIYSAFETAVQNNHQDLYTSRENGRLFIRPVTNFQLFDFEVSDNLAISKVVKTVAVEASVAGPIEQAANTIATIRTPVLGWDSATNPQAASAGRYEETDEQLRARWRNTKFQFATNIVESLYSSIFSLEGVTNVVIYENDTDEVDEIGVNPHSFLTLVDGGLESDIAKAIWQNRPAGIGSQGNTAIDIVDSFGYVRTVNFSRPVEVPIFIELSIQTDSRFPEDGENKIREALISYINNLTINDDVVYSRLYTPINTVAGHQVNSLRIGTSSDNLGFSNVTTNFDEIAKTQAVNIVFV
ncbi:baseplate J/gp47 family protein, partial [Streptomyces sp. G35A]